MRILILSPHRRHAGGVERYIEGVIAGLVDAGHDVAFLALHVGPTERAVIDLPSSVPAWVVEGGGAEAWSDARRWRADVAFIHCLDGGDGLTDLLASMPTVYFAHEYAGACISGLKTWQSVPRTCARRLGPGCLAHYYPHRCGGLSPLTAIASYRTQRWRQARLPDFSTVISGAHAMLAEMARQGVASERLRFVPYYVPEVEARARRGDLTCDRSARDFADPLVAALLFVGRVDRVKGGAVLLDALPAVARSLNRRVRLEVGGDGPQLEAWRARAKAVEHASAGRVEVMFHGWLAGEALDAAWGRSDLLVVPSVWPEPFGLVGPEAGVHGVPAAAFGVGGITEWLANGENGHVADGSGALRSRPLAAAIARCLADPAHWRRLSDGARRLAGRFRLAPHVAALEATFAAAISTARSTGAA